MQKCAALFAGQHGVAADRQVRAAGISLKRQNALIASDVWKRVHAGVIGLTGAADTWERKVMAAALAVKGAVACGRTAARVHGLDGYRKYPGIKIAVPRSARRVKIDGVKYTRLDLDDEDTTVVNGIPVTTVAVTLMQLASRGLNAGQPLDDALRRGHKPAALRETATTGANAASARSDGKWSTCGGATSTAPPKSSPTSDSRSPSPTPESWLLNAPSRSDQQPSSGRSAENDDAIGHTGLAAADWLGTPLTHR